VRDVGEQSVALDRAGITVFRDIMFLAAGLASERSRSPTETEDELMKLGDKVGIVCDHTLIEEARGIRAALE
jgi:hypothetical protein